MPSLKCSLWTVLKGVTILGNQRACNTTHPWNFLLSSCFPSECDAGLSSVWSTSGGRHGWGLLARVHRARAKVCHAGGEITLPEYCSAVLSIYSIKSKQISTGRKQALVLEMVSTWEMFCNDKKTNMNSEKVGLDLTKVMIWLDVSSYSHVFCETKRPILKTIGKFKQELNPFVHMCMAEWRHCDFCVSVITELNTACF